MGSRPSAGDGVGSAIEVESIGCVGRESYGGVKFVGDCKGVSWSSPWGSSQ